MIKMTMYHPFGGASIMLMTPEATMRVVSNMAISRKRVRTKEETLLVAGSSNCLERAGLRAKNTKAIPPTSIAMEHV